MNPDNRESTPGIFAWYGEGSYFRPHWQESLNARGFSDVDLDPIFKDHNSDLLIGMVKSIKSSQPPLILLTVGEIPLSLEGFRKLSAAKTAVFMTDDEWRFHSVGRYLALYCDLVITNTPTRVANYKSLGINNVIHAPYAANTSVFHPVKGQKKYDVTMIGAAHPDRVEIVRELIDSEIPIQVFGAGWGNYPDLKSHWGGFLSTSQMVDVIATSKIVINPGLTIGGLPQVKGRIFETAACRTFQITQHIPDLDVYYDPEIELETYKSTAEMKSKIRRYLDDDQLRESIADSAYQRTLKEHTWDSRLDLILSAASSTPTREFEPLSARVVVFKQNEDYRQQVEDAVRDDSDTMIAFDEDTEHENSGSDRIKLLAHGLKADLPEGISMNLASFDVVDSKRRVVANANIHTIAKANPKSIPEKSIIVSAHKCLEILGSHEITRENIVKHVIPAVIASGEYRHIDLDTGLFEERARGKYSVSNIYVQSVDGLWDVRTRVYSKQLIRGLSLISAFKLGVGILQRLRTRRNSRPA